MGGVAVGLNILVLVMPVILVIGGLIALYWIIRRAVVAGIRDARAERLRQGVAADRGE